jgi:transposase
VVFCKLCARVFIEFSRAVFQRLGVDDAWQIHLHNLSLLLLRHRGLPSIGIV